MHFALTRIAIFALAITTFLSGCGGMTLGMRPVETANYQPEAGMATVIFMRASRVGSKAPFPIINERGTSRTASR